MKATVSINGVEYGDLNELAANPTPELTEAVRGVVERVVGAPEPQPAAEMSTADVAELLRYEAVIKRGLESFLDVGRALMAIRDAKLYRGTHGTFEGYLGDRWGISRSYAHRTISAAQVVENLLPIGNILPANEAQARPLAKLEPDQQVEAWADAVEDSGGKPTQAHVQRAVAKFTEPKPAAPPREVKRIRDVHRKPEPTTAPPVYVDSAEPPTAELDRPGYGRNKNYDYRPHEEYYPVKHGLGVMPADLLEAGYRLVDRDGTDENVGTLGYRWAFGDEMGDDVGYAGYAIAEVATEQAEEDAERTARDAQRKPAERAVVVDEVETVTVTMPRHIAAALTQAAAAFKLGDMRLVDQAFLEGVLQDALTKGATG